MAGSVLILGVGNPFRGDDGAGPAVVRALEGRLPTGAVARVSDGDPVQLLQAFAAAPDVVVVDAVAGAGPPGTIHRFDVYEGALPAEWFRQSTHLVSIAETIELGRTLGRLSDRLVVYGIEGRFWEAGRTMSPVVAQAVERVAGLIRAEAEAWLEESGDA